MPLVQSRTALRLVLPVEPRDDSVGPSRMILLGVSDRGWVAKEPSAAKKQPAALVQDHGERDI
jgi:hypothetical protein